MTEQVNNTRPQVTSPPPSSSSPSSATSNTMDDLLAALSPSARSFHATLPAETAAEVERLREDQRKKTDTLIAFVTTESEPSALNSKLNGVLIRSRPALFLDLSHRFVSAGGLTCLCDWFDRTYAAWQRQGTLSQATSPSSSSSSSSSSEPSSAIPPELIDQLLLSVLKSWYRVSVYQKHRSRDALPKRPDTFTKLRALYGHSHPEIAELARGLVDLYEPQPSAPPQKQQDEPAADSGSANSTVTSPTPSQPSTAATSVAPETAASSQPPSQPPPLEKPPSLTAQIRQEYELARAAKKQQQLLRKAERKAAANSTSAASPPAIAQPSAAASPAPDKAMELKAAHHGAAVNGIAARVSPTPPASKTAAAAIVLPSADGGNSHSSSSNSNTAVMATATIVPSVSSSPVPPSPPSPGGIDVEKVNAVSASLVCPVCGEASTSELANYHHVSSLHRLLLCVACALTFPYEDALYAHFDGHNHSVEPADAPHACGLCGMSFHTEDGLTLHHAVHTIDRKAKQQLMLKKVRKRKLAAMLGDRKEQAGDEDDDDDKGDGPTRFPPALCSHPSHPQPLCFTSDEDLQLHAVAAHGTHHCFAVDCGAQWSSAATLADHINQHVLAAQPAGAVGSVAAHCPYCGVLWTKQVPRTEHMHRHEKPFHCPVCASRFARRTRWRNHIKRKHQQVWQQHSTLFEGVKG